MLSNASDYRYVVNPGPFANGIHGKILPAVDGTAEAYIEKYEDLCHLVETARERKHWADGYGAPAVPAFDPTTTVYDRRALQGVVEIARNLGCFSTHYSNVLIPHDWSYSNYPIYSTTSAEEVWRATMGDITRLSGFPTVRLDDADTLRRVYRDLDNMKRWIFRRALYPLSASDFEAAAPYDAFRHIVPVEPDGSIYYETGSNPIHVSADRIWSSWSTYSGGSVFENTLIPSGDANALHVYIRTPFALGPGVNPSLCYSTVNAYCEVSITCRFEDFSTGDVELLSGYMITPWPSSGAVRVTAQSGIAGIDALARVPFPIQTVRNVRDLAKNWGEAQTGKTCTGCSIIFSQLYIDTGPVVHGTALPSSWNWQPSPVL